MGKIIYCDHTMGIPIIWALYSDPQLKYWFPTFSFMIKRQWLKNMIEIST